MPPTNRLNADQQPAPFGRMPPQPRPITAAERLQSQSFANGLGRRLLSMIGIDTQKAEAQAEAASVNQSRSDGASNGGTMRALQNSTVLQQLNKGVHSIYGGLSKMYNSTIQDQLNMLQERFKSETANSTNPWHQRMARQVPAFFKQLAGKVEEAQGQLNRIWHDLSQVNSSMLSRATDQSRSFFGPIDQFLGGPSGDPFSRADVNLDGVPSQTSEADHTDQLRDLTRLRDMWNTQVEPELMMIKGQVSRIWRDLFANGAITRESIMRARQSGLNSSPNASSPDLVDSILKEVDMGSPEYSLIEPKSEAPAAPDDSSKSNQPDVGVIKLSPQMQNRVLEMQSDLNRLWMGLSNSLQTALGNVRRMLNPQPQFELANFGDPGNKQGMVEPEQKEMSNRIEDLARIQRDADMVRDALQQQQRETQQRQSLGDRFRGMIGSVDMRGINQLPDRIGEQFNRFGNAVGNFWNRLPERWDNFMTNVRQPQGAQTSAKPNAAGNPTSSSTTATTSTSER